MIDSERISCRNCRTVFFAADRFCPHCGTDSKSFYPDIQVIYGPPPIPFDDDPLPMPVKPNFLQRIRNLFRNRH